MFLSSRWEWVLVYLTLTQLVVHQVQADWPSSSQSTVQLLGLLYEYDNSSATSWAAQIHALFKAAMILSQRCNITVDGYPIGWHIAATGESVIDTLTRTCLAVSAAKVVGIVGPRTSREALTIAGFAERIGIPVVSSTATNPDLSSRPAYPTFYRTVPSDSSGAGVLASLFVRFNWTSCIIIHQNDKYGYGGATIIPAAFIKNKIAVIETIKFDIVTGTIEGDLKSSLLKSATRIVVVWASPDHAATILKQALRNDLLGPHFLWILSETISFTGFNGTLSDKLIGMLTIEPAVDSSITGAINTTLRDDAYKIWQQHEPNSFPVMDKVHPYALFTFDATWLLILALQRLCASPRTGSSAPCLSLNNASLCFDRTLNESSSLLDHTNAMDFLGISGRIQFSQNSTDRIKGINYVALNAQRRSNGVEFVPVLRYSESEEWAKERDLNVMIWPGNSLSPPNGRASLAGITVSIAIVPSDPFTMVTQSIDAFGKNTTTPVGYVPGLIKLLEEGMHFIPNITVLPLIGNYSELIQMVADGTYDIIVADVTVTTKRREMVAFSSSIFDNALRIIIRKPNSFELDLVSHLRPFSTGLWLTIAGATLCASILVCLIEGFDNDSLRDRSIDSVGAMSFWYSIGTIMGYGVDFRAATASGRMLTIALYMMSLVLVATYTANLASNLSVPKAKYIVSSIDDIKQGKVLFNRIGIDQNSAAAEYYLRHISGGILNFYPLNDTIGLLRSLSNGTIDASIMDSGTAEYLTNNEYCDLTLVGASFGDSTFGIVMQKNWLHEQDFDTQVLRLREIGELDHLRKQWFRTKKCDEPSEAAMVMGVESMAGLFLTIALIMLFSLLLLVWQRRSAIARSLSKLKTRRYAISQDTVLE